MTTGNCVVFWKKKVGPHDIKIRLEQVREVSHRRDRYTPIRRVLVRFVSKLTSPISLYGGFTLVRGELSHFSIDAFQKGVWPDGEHHDSASHDLCPPVTNVARQHIRRMSHD